MSARANLRQRAVLARTADGPADFNDLAKVGAGGQTTASMVRRGWLVEERDRGVRMWRRTQAGEDEFNRKDRP